MRTVSFTHKIVFNGKEYAGVEEMPADVRRLYEEAVRQAGSLLGAGACGEAPRAQTRVVFNGAEYRSPEELPSDLRPLCEQAMASAGLGGGPCPPPEGPSPALAGSRIAAEAKSSHFDRRFTPSPVEPEGGSIAGRLSLKLGAAVTFALLLWWILGLAR
jgi:hypothetical protein